MPQLDFLPTDYAKKVWADRYLQFENDNVFDRVASSVASDKVGLGLDEMEQYRSFLDMFNGGYGIGGGRHLCNIGGTGNNMPGNCFVLPVEDSREGIYKTLFEMAEIESKGGEVGINFSPLRPKGDIVHGSKGSACFTGDTRVLTTRGLIKIADLTTGDKVILPEGQYSIEDVYNNGIKDIVDVEFNDGRHIKTTMQHNFYVVNHSGDMIKKPLSDILEDDSVLFVSEIPDYNTDYINLEANIVRSKSQWNMNMKLNEDLGYLLGIIVADGHIGRSSKHNVISITCNYRQQDIIDKITKTITNLGFKYSIYEREDKGRSDIFIFNSLLVDGLDKFGLLKDSSNTAFVPELIYRSPQSVVASFLSGYIDGDGHYGIENSDKIHKSHRISAKTVSKILAYQVQELLASLGIHSTIIITPSKINNQTSYRIEISGGDNKKKAALILSKFSCKIPFEITTRSGRYSYNFNGLKKYIENTKDRTMYSKSVLPYNSETTGITTLKKLYEITSNPEIFNLLRYIPLSIRSITRIGNECVYDITVKEAHRYIVNGMLVSNSGPSSFVDLYDASISTISQGGCLADSTKMLTDEGEIAISELAVKGRFNLIVEDITYPSTAWYSGDKECISLSFSNGESFICTPDHPISTISGFIPAEKCLDKVCYTNDGTTTVYLIENAGVHPTYDFEEKMHHCGVANSVIVHNSRRGALIAILDVSHPDIEEFISAKKDSTRWNNLNISVAITDAFMQAVETDSDWNLEFNGKVYETVSAKELWNKICECAATSGEPGVLFLDTINRKSPLGDIRIYATNPCGEIPLVAYGACNLGSLILPNFYQDGKLNKELLEKYTALMVLYLDNLLDIANWPLDKIKETVDEYRILGIGVIGLADLLFLEGIPYGNNKRCINYVTKLFTIIKNAAVKASERLAEERGCFPAYDSNKIGYPPRRNAQLLACAPTGTISALYGASWGIEPYYSQSMIRNERLGKDTVTYQVLDKHIEKYGELPNYARFAIGDNAITVDDHLAVLAAISNIVDGAVSKTVNLPRGSGVSDVDKAYRFMYHNGIKGGTIYVEGSREVEAVTSVEAVGSNLEDEYDETDDDVIEFIDLIAEPKVRPDILEGRTYRVKPSFESESIYITINDSEDAPFEIFFSTKDSMTQEWLDMLGLTITALFRRGISCDFLVSDFMRYTSSQSGGRYKGKFISSSAAAIGMVLKDHLQGLGLMPKDSNEEGIKRIAKGEEYGQKCPNCGEMTYVKASSCASCYSCGFSKCE